MNRRHFVLPLLVASLAGGVIGYWIARQPPGETLRTSAGADHPTDERDGTILYWHDPMVPGTRFDKPGKSPFMDMELVPVYADERGGFRVSSTVTQNLGIRVGKVEKAIAQSRLHAVGSVVFVCMFVTIN